MAHIMRGIKITSAPQDKDRRDKLNQNRINSSVNQYYKEDTNDY
jgi:hypothetical protein